MAEKKTSAETGPKQKRCFMITPIGDAGSDIRKHADWVFRFAVQPTMAEKGFVTTRADMMDDPFMINDSVFAAIDESEICVADLTNLNANVFYELGVRHALEKPVIHIAHVGTRIPFDTANYRTIWFDLSCIDSMEQLTAQIASQVETIMGPDFKLSNPLTQARGFQRMASSTDSRDRLIATLQNEFSSLSKKVDHLAKAENRRHNESRNAWMNTLEPLLYHPDGTLASPSLSAQIARLNAIDDPVLADIQLHSSLAGLSEETRRILEGMPSSLTDTPQI